MDIAFLQIKPNASVLDASEIKIWDCHHNPRKAKGNKLSFDIMFCIFAFPLGKAAIIISSLIR